MGPSIILDKSAFQALSFNEISVLHRYFHVVYTRIFLSEILGNVSKYDDAAEAKSKLSTISSKLHSGEHCFTADHRTLIHANLLGNPVAMDGRPILIDGIYHGSTAVFEEQDEWKLIRRWCDGAITDEELEASRKWRTLTRGVDLRALKNMIVPPSRARTMAELRSRVQDFLMSKEMDMEGVRLIADHACLTQDQINTVYSEWMKSGMKKMDKYAPYAHYCLTLIVAFGWGVSCDLVSTRSTNIVDLEYLMYAPFASIFVSGDSFHESFVEICLRSDQLFIPSKKLKADLAAIHEFLSAMPAEELSAYKSLHGDYPPDISGSIVRRLWEERMGPPEAHRPKERTEEDKQRDQRAVNRILADYERAKRFGRR